MQSEKECYICGKSYALENHHIYFGTAKRRISDKYGLKVWLCQYHHRDQKHGVHGNRELDLLIKKQAQEVFEEQRTREEFIKLFGRSYL